MEITSEKSSQGIEIRFTFLPFAFHSCPFCIHLHHVHFDSISLLFWIFFWLRCSCWTCSCLLDVAK